MSDSPNPPGTPPGAEHLAGALERPDLADLRARLQAQLPEYQVLTCLGRGGMGAVFRAHHLRLDRQVAVKVLLPAPDAVEGWEERFLREARALARLTHPGILTVYDYGQTEGLSWIVMEFVDGANLRELMRDGRLGAAEALAIVPQICEALQYAHDHGVVHRDVKPENILLDERGRVRIADFGLAKLTADDLSVQLTGTAQAMGTLRYMAPEQLERPKEVDHRADIFSLGIVFYEMLTGRVPAGAVQPPSVEGDSDVRLDEVVMKSMERDPEERFQRAGEVAERLEGLDPTEAPAQPAGDPVEQGVGSVPGGEPPAASSDSAGTGGGDASPLRFRLRMVSLGVLVLVLASLMLLWVPAELDGWPFLEPNQIGWETDMGMLAGVSAIAIGVLLLALGGHFGGRTAALLQALLSPLVGFFAFAHTQTEYGGDGCPARYAAMALSALLTLLGLTGALVTSPGERSLLAELGSLLSRVTPRFLREDPWRWLAAAPPTLGAMLVVGLGSDVLETYLRLETSEPSPGIPSLGILPVMLLGFVALAALSLLGRGPGPRRWARRLQPLLAGLGGVYVLGLFFWFEQVELGPMASMREHLVQRKILETFTAAASFAGGTTFVGIVRLVLSRGR